MDPDPKNTISVPQHSSRAGLFIGVFDSRTSQNGTGTVWKWMKGSVKKEIKLNNKNNFSEERHRKSLTEGKKVRFFFVAIFEWEMPFTVGTFFS